MKMVRREEEKHIDGVAETIIKLMTVINVTRVKNAPSVANMANKNKESTTKTENK